MSFGANFIIHLLDEDEDMFRTIFGGFMNIYDNELVEQVLWESFNNIPELQRKDIEIGLNYQIYDRLDKDQCSICITEFECGDKVSVLEKCKHVFHTECVEEWCRYKQDCPLCKCEIILSSSGLQKDI
jgi:hypothetical protein